MLVDQWSALLSAPEFVEDLDWINTGGRPIRLADLKGRVVLLDFWTYGCINCRHLQPLLHQLKERFADALTVIGVHAGKFPHERQTPNLAAACDRQGVTHAVVNDVYYRIWRSYNASAWPTTVLIAASGEILSEFPGEYALEPMANTIEHAINDAEERGTLRRGPEPTAIPQPRAEGALRFPGRVLVAGDRLIVSDSGHGRVLDCRLSPEAPSGTRAQLGATVVAEHTGFLEPQGLALLGDALIVADRQGQVVWRVSSGGEREALLGTGMLGGRMPTSGYGPQLDLRSPWGLGWLGGSLVVSMAGSHELWQLDPETSIASAWAGTGGEELDDGPLGRALLAQPTGVSALDASCVAFADCESSSVRTADDVQGVRTLVGHGLFASGDRDGIGDAARLQHAEDLAAHQGILAVADTYNDRLKRIDPETRACHAWPGEAGEAGAFREPAGVVSDGESLFVADTGNHRIVHVSEDGSLAEVTLA